MNRMPMKFSVVIPVYNVEKYIKKCLNSVLRQSEKEFEVILIDDGSTDTSRIICDEYKEKDKRISVFHKDNGGLMSAWIKGVELSKTDYIIFVDSDDWIAPRMFERLWDSVEKYLPDMAICNFVKIEKDKKIRFSSAIEAGYYNENDIKDKIYPILLNAGNFQQRGINISRWGKIIKKEIIMDNLKYCNTKISFAEDLNIIFPVLLDCKKIVIIDTEDSDYYYRMNPFSILHSYNSTMYSQVEKVYQMINQACKDKQKNQFEKQIMADYIAAIVQTYKNELMNPKGFTTIIKNIDNIMQDEKFKKACREINWKHYGKLNVVIIWGICHSNFIFKYVITRILWKLKLYQIKKRIPFDGSGK